MAHDAHLGVSMGLLAAGLSVLQESADAALGIAQKAGSTAVITIVATAAGFFTSRWLNKRFPPPPPPSHP